ncbi:Peptidylprolyl isomerase [Rhynchospora pubera]|uniref:peptidylprolyl isomerase n=1 Tax=Rhynchospora pubera TaxID=906938 RepID=A0AAV8D3Y3_9POAL|nr:Peptidylprolyl isomerase [Rhynchospora pubera]
MASFSASASSLPHSLLSKKPLVLSCSQSPTPPTPPSNPSSNQNQNQPLQISKEAQPSIQPRPKKRTTVESTDWVASSLTRRFGIGAGLAWVGFLAFGVVSEQIKTRLEVSQQQANTRDVEKEVEVVLPNGIRYYEMKVGGGDMPRRGDLVVLDLKGQILGDNSSETFVDSFSDGRPLALVMGSRPYTKGMCEGVEDVLRSMRAGGKRRVIVPPNLAFGDDGADFGSGVQIPPGAALEYIVQVDKVSIAPA